jgi:ATP-binding cassette subfamily G (WHITE) protein 2
MCPPSTTNDDATRATAKKSMSDDGSRASGTPSVGVSFEDLSYSVKIADKNSPLRDENGNFTILKHLSGSFLPGRLTALMGPSGSGKSTLLDVLAGRKSAGTVEGGGVLFNGRAPTRNDYKFSVGYVEQFDTLVGELTVENMLRYTAELKLPASTTPQEREDRVEEVIAMLNLESCRKTVIGGPLMRGVSGGQAKRINIGLALITRPPISFLDEPTSGLDSRTADEVVECLRQLAHEQGRTVVCTIHSPTGHAFSLFDDLYMIHRGELIYDGKVHAAQAYFEGHGAVRDVNASLPEWLVDLTSEMESIQQKRRSAAAAKGLQEDERDVSMHGGTSFVDLYQKSELKAVADANRVAALEEQKKVPPVNHKRDQQAPSELSKLVTLLKYRSSAHVQSAEFMGTRFGDKIIYGLLILSLYFGLGEQTDPQSIASVSSLLFFVSALSGYGAAAFVPTLNLERKLFYRELDDGCYSSTTYYVNKFIEEAVVALFTSGLFSVIVFFGVKLTGSFWWFFLNYYLTTLIGVILAYFFAAIVPSLEAANALLPTYVTICLYFGGLFIVFDKIPPGWEWFSWTSFMRYSWGAFMLSTYRDSDLAEVPVFFDANGNPQTILDFYGFDDGPIMDSLAACLGLLAALLGIFSVMGVLALVYIRHEKR